MFRTYKAFNIIVSFNSNKLVIVIKKIKTHIVINVHCPNVSNNDKLNFFALEVDTFIFFLRSVSICYIFCDNGLRSLIFNLFIPFLIYLFETEPLDPLLFSVKLDPIMLISHILYQVEIIS